MTKEDLKLVKEFLDDQKIDVLNTRAFKKDSSNFIVSVGSIDNSKSKKDIQFKGKTFSVEYGEFAEYLKEVNKYLQEALPYAAN